MLPVLVPLVLNFLKTGTHSRNPLGSNPVLSGFLDTDHDGDVDVADALQMASRHLKKIGEVPTGREKVKGVKGKGETKSDGETR